MLAASSSFAVGEAASFRKVWAMNESERTDWLLTRKTGIGSSDASAVLGLSPWSTALSVYLDKTGQAPPKEMSQAMRWGLALEPAIAEAYRQETGRLATAPAKALARHPKRDWQIASIDREADDRIVELKTAGARQADEWGEPGTDEVPEYYLVQVQHQMAVTGHLLADIAVLIGGQDFRVYHLERSEPIIDRLTEIEAAFWDRVQRRDPPPPDWTHPGTVPLIESLYRPKDGLAVNLGCQAVELVRQYQSWGQKAGEAKDAKDQCRAELVEMMGEASLAFLPDGQRIKRKTTARRGYTVEPSEYCDFRILKAKLVREQA